MNFLLIGSKKDPPRADVGSYELNKKAVKCSITFERRGGTLMPTAENSQKDHGDAFLNTTANQFARHGSCHTGISLSLLSRS